MKGKIYLAPILLSLFLGVPQRDSSTPSKTIEESLEMRLESSGNYDYIKNFVQRGFKKFNNQEIPNPTVGSYIFSNIAEGLLGLSINHPEKKEEARLLLERLVQISLNPKLSPYKDGILNTMKLGDNGIYLSHLNVVLGAHRRLNQSHQYSELNERISRHLAEQTLADPKRHVKSFPKLDYRWPADQTVALYSLYLFDRNNKTNLSEAPIHEWLQYMRKKGKDPKTGLYISEVTGKKDYSSTPRGSALSWSLRYMANFAPEETKDLWKEYKKYFKENFLFAAGFREWPKGNDGKEDYDSGPIVYGIGASATAFGIGTANRLEDNITYSQLRTTQTMINQYTNVSGNQRLKKISQSLLARSIMFNATNQTTWF